MISKHVHSAGIGSAGQVVRGILERKELYRSKAAFHARLPMSVQGLVCRNVGKRVFSARNHEAQAIWIHVPKNAGTSVSKALDMHTLHHLPIARYAAQDAEKTRRYFKFALVRNPWDRFYSAFSYMRRHDPALKDADTKFTNRYLRSYSDFEDFVLALADDRLKRGIMDYVHFLPQTYWVTLPGERKPYMDFLGRFENIQDSFRQLAERFGYQGELPQLNRGPPRDYTTLYSPRMRDIVAEIYASDIEAFGYSFDPAEEVTANA